MIRKFKFEDEIYNSLSCLPMAARRKLDQLGLKIGFDQWQQLSRGERLMICHAPIASEDETEALRLFVHDVMLAKCGATPKELPPEQRQGVNPPKLVPPQLVESAQRWRRADPGSMGDLVMTNATRSSSWGSRRKVIS